MGIVVQQWVTALEVGGGERRMSNMDDLSSSTWRNLSDCSPSSLNPVIRLILAGFM